MSELVSRRAFLGGAAAAIAAAAGACSEDRSKGLVAGGTPVPTQGAAPAGSPGPTRFPAPTDRRSAVADPATIAARAAVPVLCWHQLRDWRAGDSAYSRALLICPPANFRAQLDALASHGYTTITADQYLDHLTTGARLPARPVMLSFDDAQGSQVSVGLPELLRRRMTGTFFIMTVVLDRPRWMRRADVRRLDQVGMTVAAHTWDHHRADRYSGRDWQVQLVRPKAELEHIIGKPVRHFAYPYGVWNRGDFPHLATAGYVTAYQLSGQLDAAKPLYTLRRMLVGSTWTGSDLLAHLARGKR